MKDKKMFEINFLMFESLILTYILGVWEISNSYFSKCFFIRKLFFKMLFIRKYIK